MLDSVSSRAAFIPVRAGTRLCATSSQLGKQTLEHQNDGNLAATGTTGYSQPTRTSLAFRLTCSVTLGLLILLWSGIHGGELTSVTSTWAVATAVCGGVFIFSDQILPVLVIAIPPGLLILAIVGLYSFR